jgi:hypothetical protein
MNNTPAHLWALAVPGILTHRNDHDHTLLGGAAPSAHAAGDRARVLQRDWGAQNPEEVLQALHWLAREGHRKEFNDICAIDLEASADVHRHGAQGIVIDDANLLAKIRFTRQHRERVGVRSLLAWDMARLISVAGWGYLTHNISEGQAWSFVWPAAQAAQRAYASWQEFGEHYLLGREFWTGERDDGFDRCLTTLLTDPTSPWRVLPWGTDLSQPDRVIPLQEIVVEVPPAPGRVAPLTTPDQAALPEANASHDDPDDVGAPAPPSHVAFVPTQVGSPKRARRGVLVGLVALGMVCITGLGLGLAVALGTFGQDKPVSRSGAPTSAGAPAPQAPRSATQRQPPAPPAKRR